LKGNSPQDTLDPGDDFMTGWVGRLVEIDHTRGNVGFDVALERGASIWDWSEVASSNKNCEIN